jgi:hypothetical protein
MNPQITQMTADKGFQGSMNMNLRKSARICGWIGI